MKMFRKVAAAILISFVFLMTGCESTYDDVGIPPIVFATIYDYSRVGGGCSARFITRDGKCYWTKDTEASIAVVTRRGMQEFEDGKLDDKIRYKNEVNEFDVVSNYLKLCKVAENENFSLEYPLEAADIWCEEFEWYGFYYDKDGELQILMYHLNSQLCDIYANDERANEIYDFFEDAVHRASEL